jgi:hypothetical protein
MPGTGPHVRLPVARRGPSGRHAFSRKVDNLYAAVSLHFLYYNFARPHGSLKNPYPRTPAMDGVSDHVWKVEEIVALLDRRPA